MRDQHTGGQARGRRRLKVAVIFGSRSVEHEVSVITALQAMDAMDPRRYDVVPILITKEGRWLTGPLLRTTESYRDLSALLSKCSPVLLHPEPDGRRLYVEEHGPIGTRRMRKIAVDCVFPIVHGTYGEDGTLQGLLELTDIPYVGAGVVGAAVGMDKIVMKMVFRAHGLPITRFTWFTRGRWEADREAVLARLESELRYPLYVKPANLGSSVGISSANDRESLADAIEVAAHFDRRLVVEEGVTNAREINCAVLGAGEQCEPSVCEEPIRWTDFLSYEDKYMQGGKGMGRGIERAKRRIPADISAELTAEIQRLAVEAFRAVDSAGVARIDFLLDPSTAQVFVNEINTLPGSLAFYLWQASGLSYPALIDRLIDLALARRRERNRTSYGIDSRLLLDFVPGGTKGKLAPRESTATVGEPNLT